MNIIAPTELILNKEKNIYHLNLKNQQIGDTIILVGDPERVKLVSEKFDVIEYQNHHREFITHTGKIGDNRISVISTGIGTDNIDIVINEIDAITNINFNKRMICKKKKSLDIIRIGTAGGLQEDISINSFVVSDYAIGLDGLAHFYSNKKILKNKISSKFQDHTNWPKELATPYTVKASKSLLEKFSDLKKGITLTTSGFYGPQGRELRITPAIKNLQNNISSFDYKNNKIVNFEMETSALYYLGQTLGHNTITICAIMGNRITKEYSKNYKQVISKMIDLVLARIC